MARVFDPCMKRAIVPTLLCISAAAQAGGPGIEHAEAPETGLEGWRWSGHGVSIEFNQLLPDQSRAYFQGRGFPPREVEEIALSCVFQTTIRNESSASPMVLDLGDWRVTKAAGHRRPIRLEADWQRAWEAGRVDQPARIAFRWSLFPTRQTFQTGDWNMGMVTFGLAPGSRFDLEVKWRQKDQTRSLRFDGMRCAPDEPV